MRPLGGGVPEDDAMEKVTSEAALRKAAVEMGPDGIEAGVRGRIRAWIEELVEAELTPRWGRRCRSGQVPIVKGIGMGTGRGR